MINRILEQFEVDGIDHFEFYFANGESVKANKLILGDTKENYIHVFGGKEEHVIPVDKILYYRIYEEGYKSMKPLT
ncbi:hypothetical protein [Staphylococcus xylosus]|uniref:hypothetical protein n=1 Tax=Staphylococcus xylosus TaxID=1288 RepID=UPI001C3F0EC3|nr:hypothetical protein [Staphylococcus xylosus]